MQPAIKSQRPDEWAAEEGASLGRRATAPSRLGRRDGRGNGNGNDSLRSALEVHGQGRLRSVCLARWRSSSNNLDRLSRFCSQIFLQIPVYTCRRWGWPQHGRERHGDMRSLLWTGVAGVIGKPVALCRVRLMVLLMRQPVGPLVGRLRPMADPRCQHSRRAQRPRMPYRKDTVAAPAGFPNCALAGIRGLLLKLWTSGS